MDLERLAGSAVGLVISYGEQVAAQVGERVMSSLSEDVYRLIERRLAGDQVAEHVLSEVREKHDDQQSAQKLTRLLLEIMASDPTFAEAVDDRVQQAMQTGVVHNVVPATVTIGKMRKSHFSMGPMTITNTRQMRFTFGGVGIAVVIGLIVLLSGVLSGGDDPNLSDRSSLDDAVAEGDQDEAPVDVGSEGGDSRGDLRGTLSADRPSSHEIELAAGEALRVWVRPTGDPEELSAETGNRYPESGLIDDGTQLAITASPVLLSEFTSAGYADEAPNVQNNFFSDYETTFFSDYLDRSTTTGFGDLLASTDDSGSVYRQSPPFFACYGRGSGSAALQGTWLNFIAPISGNYSVLVMGYGPYEVHIDSQPAADQPPPSNVGGTDLYLGDWDQLIEQHRPFMTDGNFFPVDEFFSDYDDQSGRLYGPDVIEC